MSREPQEASPSIERSILLCAVVGVLILSGFHPKDRFTWVLEIGPILIGLPFVLLTASSFPLTPLLYRLLALHAGILALGGHYTYAEVPLGFWMQDLMGLARNHYDRIGHFAQGFIPAILTREILLRRSPLVPGKWTFFLVTSVCLAFSALYELFEWGTASLTGEAAEAFLGTQGDIWDTQWDMFLALVGALTAQILLRKIHGRQLTTLSSTMIHTKDSRS